MANVHLKINDQELDVPEGTTIAVALYLAGTIVFHQSVTGESRGPLCGMGICFECCVMVDGARPIRSCMTLCREGMNVVTE